MYAQCCTASAAPTSSDELLRGGLWKCDAFRFIDSAFGLYRSVYRFAMLAYYLSSICDHSFFFCQIC